MTPIEAHRIAYLTMHGWEYHEDNDSWTKDGMEQDLLTLVGTQVSSRYYDLHDAYDCERRRHEASYA